MLIDIDVNRTRPAFVTASACSTITPFLDRTLWIPRIHDVVFPDVKGIIIQNRMAKYNFYLRTTTTTRDDQPVAVKFVMIWKRQRLQYSTGETIQPKYWCDVKGHRSYQRAKETRAFPEYSDLNERLDSLLTKAKAAFRTFRLIMAEIRTHRIN